VYANTYLPHLIELRSRLLRVVLVLVLCFIVLFFFSNSLYVYIAQPLLNELPPGHRLVATEVTAPFMVPTKLALLCAFLVSMPYLLYQIWAFVAPGLYLREQRLLMPWLLVSCLLFYSGMVFAYLLLCPLALSFFAHAAPPGVTLMIDIRLYLNFVVTLLLGGGLAFQVPVVTVACIKSGLISHQQLVRQRPYVIVGAFVLGMILTPPDVLSQIMLALPMWGLFEIGLYYARDLKTSKLPEVVPSSSSL